MPDQKLTQLTELVAPVDGDLLYVVDDPGGVPTSKKMTIARLDSRYLLPANNLSDIDNAATARTNLGLGTIATQNSNAVTISGGSITSITDLAIADGGTGQSTAQAAIDALTQVSGATNEHVLTKDTATGNAIFKVGGLLPANNLSDLVNAATARTNLGLGSIATQNSNAVTITGGSIVSITDLAIADGGTGQSTAQAAIDALTQVSGATNEHVLTKDTATGNATFKVGGAALPVADTTSVVEGSADATKELRFEVDGFTTSTTRVLTPPNADITIAGLEVAQTFTAAQKIDVASTTALFVEDNGVTDNAFVVDTANNRIGVGIVPTERFHILGGPIILQEEVFQFQLRFNVASDFAASAGVFNSQRSRGTIATPTVIQSGDDLFSILAVGHNGTQFRGGARLFFEASGNWTTSSQPTRIVFGQFSAGESGSTAPVILTVEEGSVSVGTTTMSTKLATVDEDAVTASIVSALTVGHNSSGTPAAGFGTAIDFDLESNTTEARLAAQLSTEWVVATDASRTARSVWSVYDTAAREGIRVEASGSAPLIGFYGTAATAQQTGYTTFANLATDRTLDADSTTVAEIADVLGTLIEDLKATGIISA